VQGDGEVNGTAIEASLSATLQFIVHKGAGRTMRWPRAEDAANYYTMGMDLDLDAAMREAARETVEFLQERFGHDARRRLFARQRRLEGWTPGVAM
jgi:acetamidase/formamidase